MKCDANCKTGEKASIFFSYIEEGQLTTVNLCKQCASEKGVDDPTGYSLMDMLQGMGAQTASSSAKALGASVSGDSTELVCDECGFSQADFKKTGRFGCANCYRVFSEGLESLLEAMHKKTEHVGKVPSGFDHPTGEKPKSPEKSPLAEYRDMDLDLNLEALDEEPAEDSAAPSIDINLIMLKDQLEIAISNEDYEEAAKIRDEIARIEKEAGDF